MGNLGLGPFQGGCGDIWIRGGEGALSTICLGPAGGAWALGVGLDLTSHSPRCFRRVWMTYRSSMKPMMRMSPPPARTRCLPVFAGLRIRAPARDAPAQVSKLIPGQPTSFWAQNLTYRLCRRDADGNGVNLPVRYLQKER
jgi:hypothetical protein